MMKRKMIISVPAETAVSSKNGGCHVKDNLFVPK